MSAEHVVAAQAVAATLAGCAVALGAWGSDAISAWTAVPAAALGALLPRIALRDRAARRRDAVLRRLPHDLDLITLSIEAGLNLGAALGQAARHGPPGPLRDEWQRVLRDVHAGQPRHEALHALGTAGAARGVHAGGGADRGRAAGREPALILRAQAEQRRNERFLRAERLMEAP